MELFYKWDEDKNAQLILQRGVSFEEVVLCIESGQWLEVIDHPNQRKYGHQKLWVLPIRNYIYLVPFVEKGNEIFLKTIIPSRKWTKKYLQSGG
jgi:uncharacterized DUF497 family protein